MSSRVLKKAKRNTWAVLGSLLIFIFHSTAKAENLGFKIESLQTILSKKSALVEVQQLFKIAPGPNNTSAGELRLPLPANAVSLRFANEDNSGARIEDNSVIVSGPIGSEGRLVSLQFDVPIKDKAVRIGQRLGVAIDSLEVISTWTMGADLTVEGMAKAEHMIFNDLEVLAATSSNLSSSTAINITLSGLKDNPSKLMHIATLIISTLLLASGLFWRLTKKTIKIAVADGQGK